MGEMGEMEKEITNKYVYLKYEDFSNETIDFTKKFILDTLGCGLAGTKAPGVEKTYQLFRSFGGNNESTLFGFDDKLPCHDAAFINSMVSHALDFDDTLDDAAMHCYVTAFPAALSLGEVRNVYGKQLITAVILGVDLSCRLGVAVNTPLSWIRTATCGSFGATAAASKILGLEKENFHKALGIVYSQTSGNAQCLIDGGLTKRMQPAFSARSAVISSLMAEMGITGAGEVFEGTYGYFNLYEGADYDRDVCLEGLGEEFWGNKLSIKPYPCCRMTHSSIDAALAVKEKYNVTFDDIEKIEIWVSKMSKDMVGKPFIIRQNPQVDAQFSIPYTVSVVFEKGKPFIEDFKETVVSQEKWKNLTQKIYVYNDDNFHDKDIKQARIKVHLKNGNILTHKVDTFKGHPDNPLTWDECIEKFKKCAALGIKNYSENDLDKIINKVFELEKFYVINFSRLF